MAEYIDKGALYEKIAQLEEIARNRYLDNPSNSPAYQRYIAQMQERTALKHLIADFPAVDAVPVVRCKDFRWRGMRSALCFIAANAANSTHGKRITIFASTENGGKNEHYTFEISHR